MRWGTLSRRLRASVCAKTPYLCEIIHKLHNYAKLYIHKHYYAKLFINQIMVMRGREGLDGTVGATGQKCASFSGAKP